MKRLICASLMMLMIFSLAGCGSTAAAKPVGTSGTNTVQKVLDEQMKTSEEASVPAETTQPAAPETEAAAEEEEETERMDCDVDLTKISSTMVYSEVYNMMTDPGKYIGKSVRMAGRFTLFQATDEEGKPVPDQLYYACVIADATACCSQGLEFILAGNAGYPEDYPEIGTDIQVSGTFETYEEDGRLYCHLVNAALE